MMAMTIRSARLVAVSRGTIEADARIMFASGPDGFRRFNIALS
jgi:hypothetical protein